MPSTDDPLAVFHFLARAGVPFVIIGGHAVNFSDSIELDNLRFVSLRWLRKLKQAAGRPRNLDDLEHLPSCMPCQRRYRPLLRTSRISTVSIAVVVFFAH